MSPSKRNSVTKTTIKQDERAIGFNLSYILSVAVMAVLLVGITTSFGGVVDSQQDRAVNHQTDVIADQVGSAAVSVERIASVGDNTNVSIERQLPREVVGTPYFVSLTIHESQTVIEVSARDGQSVSRTPIPTSAANIEENDVRGGGVIVIEYNDESDTLSMVRVGS